MYKITFKTDGFKTKSYIVSSKETVIRMIANRMESDVLTTNVVVKYIPDPEV